MWIAAIESQGASSAAAADVLAFYGVAFGYANDGQVLGDSAYTNLSAYLADHTTRRGRQHELDRMEAGTATARFHNTNAYMDPMNSLSPLYGLYWVGARVRMFRHESGVRYPIHEGFIERHETQWVTANKGATFKGYQEVTIQSVDAFSVVARTTALDQVHATATVVAVGSNNNIVWTDQTGGRSGVVSIAYNASAAWPATLAVGVIGNAVTITPSRNFIGFEQDTASAVIAAVKATPAANALLYGANAAGNNGTGTIGNYGESIPATFLTSPAIGWTAELTGARINRALDAVSWPTAQRSIDAGEKQVVAITFGAATDNGALAHIQEVADSEFGYVFVDASGKFTYHDYNHRDTATRSTTYQASFSDTAAPGFLPLRYSTDADEIYNDVTVTAGSGGAVPQNQNDPESIALFFRRGLSKTTQLNTDADALTIAKAIIQASQTFQLPGFPRIQELVLIDDGSITWRTKVLPLEIGDLIEITSNSLPGQLGVTFYFQGWVEAVEHRRVPGQPHVVALQLTQAWGPRP